MSFWGKLAKGVIGAGVGVITALPVFGAIGAITATGALVGAGLGSALASIADKDDKRESSKDYRVSS